MTEQARYARFPKSSTITVLVEENPKNKGTQAAARFELYQNGMTIAEYIAAGGRSGDIKNDVTAGYISLTPPAEA